MKFRNTLRNFSSLSDSFGRKHNYLRISLTEKCNFRCTYCMPEEGVELSEQSKILTAENISRIAEIFVGNLGTTKIRLTGGEPTVRRDLPQIIQSIKSHPEVESIGITTNGALLGKKLQSYADAGLDVINVSLDSLVPAKNELITRRANTQKRAIEAIDKALAMNRFQAIKLNVVVMKGFNDDELFDFAEFVRDRRVELRFIEFMPFDKNQWANDKFLSFIESKRMLEEQLGTPLQRLDDCPTSTSKNYGLPGFKGSIGFISSMSDHFCGGCNRVRITADGNLKICLFDNREINLKTMIDQGHTNDEIIEQIRTHMRLKKWSHGGVDAILERDDNRSMIKIGG